jgi:hypothetical protein
MQHGQLLKPCEQVAQTWNHVRSAEGRQEEEGQGQMTDAHKIGWLREKTGCRILDCHKALLECKGDEKKALQMLRNKIPRWEWRAS